MRAIKTKKKQKFTGVGYPLLSLLSLEYISYSQVYIDYLITDDVRWNRMTSRQFRGWELMKLG